MKNTIYILLFSFLLSCNLSKNNKLKNSSIKKLDGLWGMNNYFDEIIADKQIAKHRLKHATWFAIVLEISNDSMKSYGSIKEFEKKLNYNSDTLAVFDFYGKYGLFFKK